jgi:hypothetical protein
MQVLRNPLINQVSLNGAAPGPEFDLCQYSGDFPVYHFAYYGIWKKLLRRFSGFLSGNKVKFEHNIHAGTLNS